MPEALPEASPNMVERHSTNLPTWWSEIPHGAGGAGNRPGPGTKKARNHEGCGPERKRRECSVVFLEVARLVIAALLGEGWKVAGVVLAGVGYQWL